jgi:hypothetical protein
VSLLRPTALAVLVLHARTNRLQDLIEPVPNIESALRNPLPGLTTTLGMESGRGGRVVIGVAFSVGAIGHTRRFLCG